MSWTAFVLSPIDGVVTRVIDYKRKAVNVIAKFIDKSLCKGFADTLGLAWCIITGNLGKLQKFMVVL